MGGIWILAKNLDFDRNLPCPIVKNHDFLTLSRRKNKTINQNTLNIIYSKLNKVFNKCLRLEQKTHSPQIILKIGTKQ